MSPRDPPPPVKFEEFDGLNRILFSRMNKTVHANFGAKGVREMCEKNYRTWCAENGTVSLWYSLDSRGSDEVMERWFGPWRVQAHLNS